MRKSHQSAQNVAQEDQLSLYICQSYKFSKGDHQNLDVFNGLTKKTANVVKKTKRKAKVKTFMNPFM